MKIKKITGYTVVSNRSHRNGKTYKEKEYKLIVEEKYGYPICKTKRYAEQFRYWESDKVVKVEIKVIKN